MIDFIQAVRRMWQKSVVPSVLVAVVLTGYLVYQIRSLNQAQNWIDHSDQAISQVLLIQKLMLDAETGVRGYILTRDPVTLAPYLDQHDQFEAALKTSSNFVHDNRSQEVLIDQIRSLFATWLERARGIENQRDLRPATEYFGRGDGRLVMDACRRKVDEFLANEQKLRQAREAQIKRKIPRVIFSAAASTLFLRILGLWLLKRLRGQA